MISTVKLQKRDYLLLFILQFTKIRKYIMSLTITIEVDFKTCLKCFVFCLLTV